jgi:hypothetical protein
VTCAALSKDSQELTALRSAREAGKTSRPSTARIAVPPKTITALDSQDSRDSQPDPSFPSRATSGLEVVTAALPAVEVKSSPLRGFDAPSEPSTSGFIVSPFIPRRPSPRIAAVPKPQSPQPVEPVTSASPPLGAVTVAVLDLEPRKPATAVFPGRRRSPVLVGGAKVPGKDLPPLTPSVRVSPVRTFERPVAGHRPSMELVGTTIPSSSAPPHFSASQPFVGHSLEALLIEPSLQFDPSVVVSLAGVESVVDAVSAQSSVRAWPDTEGPQLGFASSPDTGSRL